MKQKETERKSKGLTKSMVARLKLKNLNGKKRGPTLVVQGGDRILRGRLELGRDVVRKMQKSRKKEQSRDGYCIR